MRTIQTGRGVSQTALSPTQIAWLRTAGFHHADAEHFMQVFIASRTDEVMGNDTWWQWRNFCTMGDSVGMAAMIEGLASVRAERNQR